MVGAYRLGFNRGFKDDIWSFQSFAEAFRQFAEAFRQFAELKEGEGEKEKERKGKKRKEKRKSEKGSAKVGGMIRTEKLAKRRWFENSRVFLNQIGWKMPKLCTFFTFRLVGWLGRLGWSDHKNRIGCKAPYPSTTSHQISTKSVKA